MPSSRDVANYFLTRAKLDSGAGDSISNLKMQKLVYYAQGIHIAITGSRLFNEQIEAWKHGPVVRSLYNAFKQYGEGAIPAPESFDAVKTFTPEQLELLDEVYNVYGQFSAWKLRDMTHEEAPWKDADARGAVLIEDSALREFFLTRLES